MCGALAGGPLRVWWRWWLLAFAVAVGSCLAAATLLMLVLGPPREASCTVPRYIG